MILISFNQSLFLKLPPSVPNFLQLPQPHNYKFATLFTCPLLVAPVTAYFALHIFTRGPLAQQKLTPTRLPRVVSLVKSAATTLNSLYLPHLFRIALFTFIAMVRLCIDCGALVVWPSETHFL